MDYTSRLKKLALPIFYLTGTLEVKIFLQKMCTNLGYFLFQHCKIGIGNSYFIHSTCMLLTGMENIKPLANNHHCEIGIAKSYFIHNTCMLLTGMGRVFFF